MLDHLEYIEFKNAVPKGFAEDGCDAFNLSIPVEKGFTKAKNKVVVVIGYVNFKDLKHKKLLGDDSVRTVTSNILKYAREQAKLIGKVEDTKFAIINFNYFKNRHLEQAMYANSLKFKTDRVLDFIDKLKPDNVLVFGDEAAQCLVPKIQTATKSSGIVTRGNANKIKHKGTTYRVFTSIAFDGAFSSKYENFEHTELDEDAVVKANILGYTARCCIGAFIGRTPYDLSGLKPEYLLVDSLKKFKRMMKAVESANIVSVDTETANLTVHKNKIVSFQFCINKELAWFLPFKHKNTPFNSKELKIITKRLRKFFMKKVVYDAKNPKYLIGHNFGFDCRLIRQDLKIAHIYWPVWDTLAGEYCLDENMKALQLHGNKPYELQEVFARYNNTHYYTSSFAKSDRVFIANMEITDALVEYGCMDVIAPFAIHEMQRERARVQTIGVNAEKSYLKMYDKLMLNQMSNTVKVMSVMMQRGVKIDLIYLISMLNKNSEFNAKIDDCIKAFNNSPNVKKANKLLQKKRGVPSKSLFSKDGPWLFDLSKDEHKQILFFKVLKLKPTSKNKKDGGSLDKAFKDAYKDSCNEVKLLHELDKLRKLKSSYVDAFFKRVSDSPDGKVDGRIRPGFGYKDVVTGRSNSFKPSLQQIPEHGDNAKFIKRMFITPLGYLGIEADYSAHEVRCGGIVAKDNMMLKGFRAIHNLIVKYRKKPTDENRTNMKIKGDSHKMNYSFFTGMSMDEWIKMDKTDSGKSMAKDLRRITKGIVFGAMYGKGAKSISADIGKPLAEAEKILKSFFAKFSGLRKWLNWAMKFSKTNLYVFSPIGRRRNLFGYLTEVPVMVANMERRAQNSVIQGFASDISFNAANLFCEKMYELLVELGDMETLKEWMPIGPNVMVHDSIKTEAPFKYVYLTMHLMEWCLTTGVQEYMEELYGIKFDTPLGIDFEVGAAWSLKEGWDLDANKLDSVVEKALKWHVEVHKVKDAEMYVKRNMKLITSSWVEQNKKLRITERFPLHLSSIKDAA